MSQLEQVRAKPQTAPGNVPTVGQLTRSHQRQLAALRQQTVMRVAGVQSDGIVTKEKMTELDHLAREAMTGQAMLTSWAGALAADNAVLYEQLQFFVGVARMGKGQVMADLVESYCREGR